jgi:asparagine N-glycosylation enzyme membrane subunit Stt3
MLSALYFFIYSLRRGSVFSFLAGFSMFLGGLFWNGWPIILEVLTVGAIFGIAINYFKGNPTSKLIVSYGVASFSGLFLLYLFRSLFYRYEVSLQETGMFFIAFKLLFAVLLAMTLLEILNITQRRKSTKLLIPAVALLIVAGMAFKLGYFDYLADLGRFKDTTKGIALMEVPTYMWRLGIAEQRPVALTYLTHIYSLPVLLAPIGAVLVLKNFFALSYALVSLSFLIFQIRFTFIAAPVVCLLAALVLNYMLEKRRHLSAVFILLIIFPNAYASINSSSAVESLVTEDLYEALRWMDNNTPEDSVILAWWDYTGPILAIGDRKTVTHTAPSGIVESFSLMLRTSNETQALEIARSMNEDFTYRNMKVDYILVDRRLMELWPKITMFRPYVNPDVRVENRDILSSMLYKLYTNKSLSHFKLVFSKGDVKIYQPLYNYTRITEIEVDRYHSKNEEVKIGVKARSTEFEEAILRIKVSDPEKNLIFSKEEIIKGSSQISFVLPGNATRGVYTILAELHTPDEEKTHFMGRDFIVI